ncbi:hypothetical protein D3C73_1569710 [compost metagenome]
MTVQARVNKVEPANIGLVIFTQLQRVETCNSSLIAAQKYSVPAFQGYTCAAVLTAVISTP